MTVSCCGLLLPIFDTNSSFFILVLSPEACFPEFGTISDGTPSFATVEAVRVTKVTLKGEIISPLIAFELYDKSSDGKGHANHLIKALKRKSHSPRQLLEDWLVATQDGCKVNIAAVRHIKENTIYNPDGSTCCSHTLCLSGTYFETPNLKMLRKRVNIIIRYRGKFVDHYKEHHGESPIKSGGIRWWIEFEQAAQWAEHGIVSIVQTLCPWGVANNASKISCESLLGEFSMDQPVSCERLALAMVENAAVVDGGRLFAVMTYILEGNEPLILSAYRAFEDLDELVGNDSPGPVVIKFPNVEKIAPAAVKMIQSMQAPLNKNVEAAIVKLQTCADTLETKKEDCLTVIKAAKTAVKSARKALNESRKTLEDWNDEHGNHLTVTGLLQHAWD